MKPLIVHNKYLLLWTNMFWLNAWASQWRKGSLVAATIKNLRMSLGFPADFRQF